MPSTSPKVFLSYSHRDESWKDRLCTHLGVLEAEDRLVIWNDRDIPAGSDWHKEIVEAMNAAEVAVILISANFLTSSLIRTEEVPRLLARRKQKRMVIVPVIVRSCPWEAVEWLVGIKARPRDGRPLAARRGDRVDEALAEIAAEILELAQGGRHRSIVLEEPRYASDRVRELSLSLEAAYARKLQLETAEEDTSTVLEEIRGLKRRLREGGQLQAGDLLSDRFKLIEQIGRGGFAIVWKAADQELHELVALKVLHGQYAQDRTRRERFFRGARKMSELQHQGIVRVIEPRLEDGGYYFFVMEYVKAGDLRRAVMESRISTEAGLAVVRKVAAALEFAHERNIIHRDIKPANILLAAHGEPKLTDFDLVRAAETTGGTRTGSMLGTFLYMAPEAMEFSKAVGVEAEVYSLGMTAAFVLYGADLPSAILRDSQRFFARLKCENRIREALVTATAWNPARRFRSAREFASALKEGTQPEKEPPSDKSQPPRLTRSREHGSTGEKKERPFLAEYTRDLTALAAQDTFDPLIGREKQLERIIQVLSRHTKNNPILLGPAGVGKSDLVRGLAQRMAEEEITALLRRQRIIDLDLSQIIAGTKYRGQFEERLKGILKELKEMGDAVVFIDEIHRLFEAGSILKPTLLRGEVSCIGATTQREYRKHIEKERWMLRHFQVVQIDPPSTKETFRILDGIKSRYEAFHKVPYSEEALRTAVALSDRYITDLVQPEKAIDLMDEAGSYAKLRREQDDQDGELVVTSSDIEAVISARTGVVLESQPTMPKRLATMAKSLRHSVIGQNHAIDAVSRTIRSSWLTASNRRRPVGSFVFLGPPGVGKTELSTRLAEHLFDSQEMFVRLDMSEYMEKHAIAKLIGSPSGYVGHEGGGLLTERVTRQPYSVVLLDAIEKAHPDVTNLLFQILDVGRLIDAYGNSVDFTNTILLMTSNIGSKLVLRGGRVGFEERQSLQRIEEEIRAELCRSFSREFINRIDEVILFKPLGKEELLSIVDILLADIHAIMTDRQLEMTVTNDVKEWLIEKAEIEPSTGARPLRRALQRHLLDALSELLIAQHGEKIESIEIVLEDDEIQFACT